MRCAPPANKPTPAEIGRCEPYLLDELALLDRTRVVVALGQSAGDGASASVAGARAAAAEPTPRFGHGSSDRFADGVTLLGSYHPSQQNTFTGKLTRRCCDGIFERARDLLSAPIGAAR